MTKQVHLGLKENWKQFTLLVIVNGFVGGMVGMERSIRPQIAEKEFAIAARTAILSFIIVFGIVKAVTNYYTGALANRFGRKNQLVAGWIIGIPIPFMLMFAPSWGWIIAANVLFGINQGLTWSSTVVMKIDLVGEKQRGFAMGLNEFAGYISVALVAFLTGWIASAGGTVDEDGLFASRLIADVLQHFADEEQAIVPAGFPGATAHVVLHRELADQAQRLAANSGSGRQGVGDVFQFLAYDVVTRHMLVADREFFAHLQSHAPARKSRAPAERNRRPPRQRVR